MARMVNSGTLRAEMSGPKCSDCGAATFRVVSLKNLTGHEFLCASCEYLRARIRMTDEERLRGYEDAYYGQGEHPSMEGRFLDARRDAYQDGYQHGERVRRADRV